MLLPRTSKARAAGHDLGDGRRHKRPVDVLGDKLVAFWIDHQHHLSGSERGDLLLDSGVTLGGGQEKRPDDAATRMVQCVLKAQRLNIGRRFP